MGHASSGIQRTHVVGTTIANSSFKNGVTLIYRPEIDGLRAVAVIPVVIFHAGFNVFSGGYLGVDIFFVISGYLITSLILAELNEGKFSLLDFYERRARRILPALFFVVFSCLPFAWILLIPKQMEDFSQSLVAAATFSSNLLFWLESGYFSQDASLKPLLHTWSLAVEEQFYIGFPILMMALWRFKAAILFVATAVLFVLSLALAQWLVHSEPETAYFLLPTRGWEILLGSLCAFVLVYKQPKSSNDLNQLMSLVGLILIAASFIWFNKSTPTPSLWTLLPTTGAALLIIFAKHGTLANRLLSSKFFVGIGLVSYSLYLWHQPVLAFYKHYNFLDTPSQFSSIVLILLSCALAWVSWKFVERPFRNREKVKTKTVFLFSFLGLTILISIGVYGHLQQGFKERTNLSAFPKTLADSYCYNNGRRSIEQVSKGDVCLLGNKKGEPDVAIYGDSHAGALLESFGQHAKNSEATVAALSSAYCPPVQDFYLRDYGRKRCKTRNDATLQYLLNQESIKTVVLVAQWTNYTKGHQDHQPISPAHFGTNVANTDSERKEALEQAIKNTITSLEKSGKKVLLIKGLPEFRHKIMDTMERFSLRNMQISPQTKAFSINSDEYEKRNKEVTAIFESLDSEKFVDVKDLFCTDTGCQSIADNRPIFSDTNHVTSIGAELIVESLTGRLFTNSQPTEE